jgi:hypothetical protein
LAAVGCHDKPAAWPPPKSPKRQHAANDVAATRRQGATGGDGWPAYLLRPANRRADLVHRARFDRPAEGFECPHDVRVVHPYPEARFFKRAEGLQRPLQLRAELVHLVWFGRHAEVRQRLHDVRVVC